MIVFKSYFKIVKKHLGLIIMFAAISIVMSVANTTYNNAEESYTSTNSNLAIINYDSSKLVDNFIEYIDINNTILDIDDNEKDIQDALYNNKVDAILIIPENFTEQLLSGKEPTIGIKKSLQNASEYTTILVNNYFNIASFYTKTGMSEEEIIKNINEDIKKEIEVKISSEQKSNLEKLAIYYSFENYAFLSIFIFIIGTIMCIFNQETIKKRNAVSKMKTRKFSTYLFFGHMSLTITLWAIFVLVSVIIYKDLMLTANALLLVINSLIFAITVTSMAYLIGNLIKNKNVISGIQNVISLGLSFISGCFVSMELLDSSIISVAKFFPSYWFIKGNYDIVKLSNFDFNTLKPIIQNFVLVLAFGVLYFVISQFVNARRKN